MITEQDLQQAIAECQGQRNPTANTCIKLAAFYTIRRELFGEEKEAIQPQGYSFMPEPSTASSLIQTSGDSDFSRIINGRTQQEIIPVLEELMDTLQVIQPRLYTAVMDKLS